jgi:hypothetical protein
MVLCKIVKINKNSVLSNETINVDDKIRKINIYTLNDEMNEDVDLIHEYFLDGSYYCVFGNVTNDSPGKENIYELPPPYDTVLYFNNLYIVKCKSFKREWCKEIENLSVNRWNEVYKTLFGGFESVDDTDDDDDSYEEELEIDPNQLTSSGYVKDDFVVSDDNEEEVEDEESTEVEEEEEDEYTEEEEEEEDEDEYEDEEEEEDEYTEEEENK